MVFYHVLSKISQMCCSSHALGYPWLGIKWNQDEEWWEGIEQQRACCGCSGHWNDCMTFLAQEISTTELNQFLRTWGSLRIPRCWKFQSLLDSSRWIATCVFCSLESMPLSFHGLARLEHAVTTNSSRIAIWADFGRHTLCMLRHDGDQKKIQNSLWGEAPVKSAAFQLKGS
jgi:hypothetical protein